MTIKGRYTPPKTKHDYIDLNPDPHPPVDCKEGRIKYDAIKQAIEICNNLFVNGSILSPWPLEGDGTWKGETPSDAVEWDTTNGGTDTGTRRIKFNKDFIFSDGSSNWFSMSHLANNIVIGGSFDPNFYFDGHGTFSKPGSGSSDFGGDVLVEGEFETYSGRIVNTTNIDNTDSPYSVLSSDHEIFVDTDAGAVALNLPAGVGGTKYRIINCGSSGNDVTVAPNGRELLTGANSSEIISDGEVMIITYNATQGWW